MIKKFDLKYLDDILEIEKKAFPKTSYDEFTFIYYSELYPDNFFVYELESSQKIIGYIIFEPNGHIISIAVDKLYRRKRIGTKLMNVVLNRYNGKGIVEVRESNKIAKNFYKKLGFVQVDVLKNYYQDENGVIMVKKSNTPS